MVIFRNAFLVVLLGLAACGGPADQGPPPAAPVGVITVSAQPVSLTVELPGRTAAFELSEVRPQVNGLITARLFTEGDWVHQGQALYRVDPQPYLTQVASARAALARAQAAIGSSEALRRRYGELVKINAIARQDYDNAATTAQQARADVAAQSAALHSAQIDLARTTVRAPISGRIGRSEVTTGALVTAAQPTALATIQNLDPIFVDIPQSSVQLLKLRQQLAQGQLLRAGEAARVLLKLEDGSNYPVEGRLQFTATSVDPSTGSQSIRAVFANRAGVLLPGMFVRAILSQGSRPDAILIPQRAVSRDEKGRATVLVVTPDNKAAPRVLVVDQTQGDNWVVSSGLKPGDRVIVDGAMMLRPGSPVKPVP
jgi:membrane fusion protein (multidrug efflux system)